MEGGLGILSLERQLTVRGIPAIGKNLLLELHGQRQSSYVVATAASETILDLGSLGVLRLDPSSLEIVDSGLLNSFGQADIQVSVPLDASLVGQTFILQALVGQPNRLTGLERIVLTDL